MKRALIATGITIAGLAAIAGYRVSPHSLDVGAAVQPTPPPIPTSMPSPDAPATTLKASPSPSTPAAVSGTFTGSDFPNRFGDVAVRVVISNGHITDVQALQLPYDRQRSAEISQQAGPLLHDEVVQAQSAQIDILSGATFTSQSYAQSVQSALDQAHS